MLRRFRKSSAGATAIEYGLIIALIALVMLVGLTALGGKSNSQFERVKSEAGKALK